MIYKHAEEEGRCIIMNNNREYYLKNLKIAKKYIKDNSISKPDWFPKRKLTALEIECAKGMIAMSEEEIKKIYYENAKGMMGMTEEEIFEMQRLEYNILDTINNYLGADLL